MFSAPESSSDDGGDAPSPYSPYNAYHPYYYYPDYSSPSDALPSPGRYRPPPPPGPGRGPPPRPFPPPPDFDPGLVRPEEAAIVTVVLVIWVFAVVLFVHRWGKIRMLVPHQPRYAYAEANADKLKVSS